MSSTKEIEVWKDIPRLIGAYQISDLGRVRSLDRCVDTSYTTHLGNPAKRTTCTKGKVISTPIQRTGYKRVKLIFEGNSIGVTVHREVALAFCEGYMEGLVVNHVDGNKANNIATNLEWVTRSYNSVHGNKLKKEDVVFGKAALAYTGSVDAYNKDTGTHVCNMKGNRDMKDRGFDYRLVSAVLMGKRNHHRGCVFKKNSDNPKDNLVPCGITLSKVNFIPLNYYNLDKELIGCILTFDELLSLDFTPLRVIQVLSGKHKTHKGFYFQVKT